MTNHNFRKLEAVIVANSEAKKFGDAQKEWELCAFHISSKTEDCSCICGKRPIVDSVALRNRRNGNELIVGSVCARRFLSINLDPIFASIKHLENNIEAAIGQRAAQILFQLGYLSPWECRFLLSTRTNRVLSPKQINTRRRINHGLVNAVRTQRDAATQQPSNRGANHG